MRFNEKGRPLLPSFKKPNPKIIKKGTEMTNLPFALSFSKINEWYQCPTKFYVTYLTKEVQFKDTPETIKGKEKHKALEDYGLYGTSSPILEVHEYSLITKLRALKEAKILYESQAMFGFTSIEFNKVHPLQKMWDKKPNGDPFFLIGQADVICITDSTAVVIDHKSGKMKKQYNKTYERDKLKANVQDGWLQLQLYAIYTFLCYPEVNAVKCILNYLKDGAQIYKIYTRSQLAELQLTAQQTCEHILADYAQFIKFENRYKEISAYNNLMLAHSEINGNYTPLCGWCGYKDKCIKYSKKSIAEGEYDKNARNNNISSSPEPLNGELLLE